MWTAFVNALNTGHWGDVASVAGVFIAVIGFGVTIYNTIRTKKAAEQADQRIEEVRRGLRHVDTVAELSQALLMMEEVKRLHRDKMWPGLPEKCSALRQLLISIRSANAELSDDQGAAIQSAIVAFRQLESKVERTLAAGAGPPDVPRTNAAVSRQMDQLREVLVCIRDSQGR